MSAHSRRSTAQPSSYKEFNSKGERSTILSGQDLDQQHLMNKNNQEEHRDSSSGENSAHSSSDIETNATIQSGSPHSSTDREVLIMGSLKNATKKGSHTEHGKHVKPSQYTSRRGSHDNHNNRALSCMGSDYEASDIIGAINDKIPTILQNKVNMHESRSN